MFSKKRKLNYKNADEKQSKGVPENRSQALKFAFVRVRMDAVAETTKATKKMKKKLK